ncbi:wee1-like protein kinase isoform X2 [Camellia sinensis]|uniref:wee1-like protein kinase isoform X2 n=1 Tax=Camellia sinensis TaxID=4442 RepID=UPI00103621EB|nr:wee1-like protein kinase isoform X2 [Camellia sinensis]
MKGSLAGHLTVEQLGQVSFFPLRQQSSESQLPSSSPLNIDIDSIADDKDFILSQDFFCTPDYITPDGQYISNLDCNKENISCPKSPEKLKTVKSKRQRQDGISDFSSNLSCHDQTVELPKDAFGIDEIMTEKAVGAESQKIHSYVSQSAVALRCRVMPPPCIKNPCIKDVSKIDIDPFSNRRSKCAGIFPTTIGGDGLSRYRTDFHEIEQIGNGNFSHVFKVLKRIDGCLYAVKKSTRLLHQDMERRKALMEVQALAALGFHENLVGYYSSWFENEQLFIQMELCDHSLSIRRSKLFTEVEVLEILHQIAKALKFIHERGIAHLDVKPENIYVKNGVYKLGDFGCATLIDKSLPIEEGDARYMPQEILNDNYDHLDKVDIFSLGAAIYELIRGSALPESGPLSLNLREGKLPLLPVHSVQFHNLLKVSVGKFVQSNDFTV